MAPTGQEKNKQLPANASEFRWGKKKGVGKDKNVQFYSSFFYDGVEYNLYDSVHVHKDGEPEPYVAKIVKLWGDSDVKKKQKRCVKLHWFFRPIEIRNFFSTDNLQSGKEIFLASGTGKGVSNINTPEVILGKCTVLCTAEDTNNLQPSQEDLTCADYVFNRTFNVDKLCVSEDLKDIEDDVKYNKQTWMGKLASTTRKEEIKKRKVNAVQRSPKKENISKPSDAGTFQTEKKNRDIVKESRDGDRENATLERNKLQKDIPNTKRDEPGENGSELKHKKECGGMENYKSQFQKDTQQKLASKEEHVKKSGTLEKLRCEDAQNRAQHERIAREMKNDSVTCGGVQDDIKVMRDKPSMDEKKFVKKEQGNENGIEGKGLRYGLEKVSINKAIPNKEEKKEPASLVEDELDRKCTRDRLPEEEKKNAKRAKLRIDSDEENERASPLQNVVETPKRKHTSTGEDPSLDNKGNKKIKTNDGSSQPAVKKASTPAVPNKPKKGVGELIEISKKPEEVTNKWFAAPSWEDQLQKGYEQGAVLHLQNFDPSYTSSDIEDIIWHVFGEHCTAKVIPQNAFLNPRSGDALVVFKKRTAAENALDRLEEACLIFQDGRPLIAKMASGIPSGKQKFAGHIGIEKHKLQMQRAHQTEDMKKAVASSHCSQPNTIEYEMAMEWRLLQEKSERCWKELSKKFRQDLDKVKKQRDVLLNLNKKAAD